MFIEKKEIIFICISQIHGRLTPRFFALTRSDTFPKWSDPLARKSNSRPRIKTSAYLCAAQQYKTLQVL